jgi:CPA2 family monovalent cation:H+ antiporter-2
VVAAIVIIIAASVEMERITDWLEARWHLPEKNVRLIVIGCGNLLAAPFVLGAIRMSRYLGFELASRVFPNRGANQVDLAAAPRRLLVATLQLAIVIAVGVPLIAVTQPFIPKYILPAALLITVALLAIAFWRNAATLQSHTRAGAQAIIDKLAQQMQSAAAATSDPAAASLDELMSGLGSPAPIEIRSGNPNIGRSLAEINLRGLTGATVLAIRRDNHSVLVPAGHDRLEVGDILAIAGTHKAVEAADEMLGR